MRITSVNVKGLFGAFDHFIPLNQQERITIIHGPNGYGKTAILQFLDALLGAGSLQHLQTVPFEEIRVDFSDGSALVAEQRAVAALERPVTLRYGAEQLIVTEVRKREASFLEKLTARLGTATGNQLAIPNLDADDAQEPGWLQGLRDRFSVLLVNTQRLLSANHIPTVSLHAEALANKIQEARNAYTTLTSQLDSSFVTRLISPQAPPRSLAEITQSLTNIDHERERLTKLGLLDPNVYRAPPHIDASKLDVLSIFVQDIEDKFQVFRPLAARIALFVEIINRRFKHKQIVISKDRGFQFVSRAQEQPLPPTCLSSGEQHELVLLYELIFNVKPDALILIDEPELSLHLSWQQNFLTDLGKMVELSQFDVLLATHAPAIIGRRLDLTVDLKEPRR